MSIKLEKVSKFKKQQNLNSDPAQRAKNPKTRYPTFQEEFDPSFISKSISSNAQLPGSQTQGESQFFYRHYQHRQFEDSILTNFIFRKIVLIRVTMMCIALTTVLLSILASSSIGEGLLSQNFQSQILIFYSISTAVLIAMTVLKELLHTNLEQMQLQARKPRSPVFNFVKEVSAQVGILFIHPNFLLQSWHFLLQEPIYGRLVEVKVNDILQILMQVRVYLLLCTIIKCSIYCNTRANRLCRIYSTKQSTLFGVKSLFEYQPLTFLVILYGSLIVCFGQMISISERELQPEFRNFQNSLWFIIITMGTVGYGQYSPKTYPGRVISFSAAISGIIISSLLILTLGRYLSMSNREYKSHVTLRRLELRKVLESYSKQTIAFTTRMALSQSGRSTEKRAMEQLKTKTQRVKLALRRIKNMVDSNNLKEEINRLFEALSESLNEIYNYQERYSDLLIELYQKEKEAINEMQFCFTTEIENIIKDR